MLVLWGPGDCYVLGHRAVQEVMAMPGSSTYAVQTLDTYWPLVDVVIISKVLSTITLDLTLYVLFFQRERKNIYLNFVSFLHIDATQVFEIIPQIRQEPSYST